MWDTFIGFYIERKYVNPYLECLLPCVIYVLVFYKFFTREGTALLKWPIAAIKWVHVRKSYLIAISSVFG